jgi:hypothetical protein
MFTLHYYVDEKKFGWFYPCDVVVSCCGGCVASPASYLTGPLNHQPKVLLGDGPITDGAEARKSLEICLAAIRSAAENQPIRIGG